MRIIDKIFADKKNSSVIYILLAVGILLLVGGNAKVHNEPTVINDEFVASSDLLKTETEKILSEIEGVGEVRVMISYSTQEESDSAFSSGSSRNKEERREVESVLVVADGGDNAKVCEKIVRALKSALGVESHKIEVFERKEIQ